MGYDIELFKEKLRDRLIPRHYDHSVRTADVAARMARAYLIDEDKAYVAGLLHDYSKSMSDEGLVESAKRLGIELHPVELGYPYLVHARVAARLVEEELGVTDKEIVNAIEHHTFGAPMMSELDKVIYVADMIEPGRPHGGLDKLRRMALDDLDMVFREAYAHSLGHLVKSRKLIHPMTVEVWNKLVSM